MKCDICGEEYTPKVTIRKYKTCYNENCRKERRKIIDKNYWNKPENQEKRRIYEKTRREKPENRKKRKTYFKIYLNKSENQKQRRKYMKEYLQRPEIAKRTKEYKKEYNQSPEGIERIKEHRNKPEVKERRNQKERERRNNPTYKLRGGMGSRIRTSLKGNKGGRHWEGLVNYTLKDLKKHLEKQFTDEMSWDNYGTYWHLEHIIPISAFNFSNPKHIDFRRCWELSNLRPLEKIENLSKGGKLIKDFQLGLKV